MRQPITQEIVHSSSKVRLFVRREDLLHPEISGNKFRKLKYNVAEAKKLGLPILTFGGAFSNHIAATAAAGHLHGIRTIGVIRGDELASINLNPTLKLARSQGMELHFINRESYRDRHKPELAGLLQQRFGAFYLLPEGGTNELAVRGCEEILAEADFGFDYICVASGTGGTVAGISRRAATHQHILGFAAVRDESVSGLIRSYSDKENWKLIDRYDFGGYGKIDVQLIDFVNDFKQSHGIPLDPVYTGKMMFGVMKMIDDGYFSPGSTILIIHTGGLQGIEGMNQWLRNANLRLIK